MLHYIVINPIWEREREPIPNEKNSFPWFAGEIGNSKISYLVFKKMCMFFVIKYYHFDVIIYIRSIYSGIFNLKIREIYMKQDAMTIPWELCRAIEGSFN